MVSKIDVIYDRAEKSLEAIPDEVLGLNNLQMIYLEGNCIEYLPSDIFQRLPRLTWLDLRNNKLKELPTGIAHHENIDTLLLENNLLEKLPNELGLCPNLLVLQINNNPLVYPKKEIIEKGAIATCEFLKEQYQKQNPSSLTSIACLLEECSQTTEQISKALPNPYRSPSKKKMSVQELLRRASNAAKLYRTDTPVMTVKSLSAKNTSSENSTEAIPESGDTSEDKRIGTRNRRTKQPTFCAKLSTNSHNNSSKYLNARKARPNRERVIDQQIKDLWLAKLKELLDQQETLLQQEKNLRALSAWRFQKKMEPVTKVQQARVEPPFDTDPEYDSMIQREELYREVDKMVRKKKRLMQSVDMRKMISEIVLQLKELELKNAKDKGDAAKERGDQRESEEFNMDKGRETRAMQMARAENEIRRIIDLHKKVTSLQQMNHVTL